jgi:hypothetical protein
MHERGAFSLPVLMVTGPEHRPPCRRDYLASADEVSVFVGDAVGLEAFAEALRSEFCQCGVEFVEDLIRDATGRLLAAGLGFGFCGGHGGEGLELRTEVAQDGGFVTHGYLDVRLEADFGAGKNGAAFLKDAAHGLKLSAGGLLYEGEGEIDDIAVKAVQRPAILAH